MSGLTLLVVVIIVYMLFVIVSFKSEKEAEFLSSYECGFEPMSKVRIEFSYRFFLLAILFLVFDVEVILFLISPFIIFNLYGYWILILFMFVLISGLIYEWSWGSLDWL